MRRNLRWYIACSILVTIVTVQAIQYFDLNNRHRSVSAELESIQEEKNGLMSQYEVLSSNYSWLVDNYTSRIVEYSMLLSEYSNSDYQYTHISLEYDLLQANFTNLEATFQGLQTTYASLQENYSELQTQTDQLQADYHSISQSYDTLDQAYDHLQSQCIALQESFSEYVSAYQDLQEKINQRLTPTTNIASFITPQDASVSATVFAITGGWSDPSDWNEYWDDIELMYHWVCDNIDYRSDGLYPELPDDPFGTLILSQDMWQFANETLELRKGDCEDQAILLCSMIRSYSDMQHYAECIWITCSSTAHVGVQLPVAGGKLVIFDPAGDYYSSDWLGNIVFDDINTEINNWLDYWATQIGETFRVSRVFSDYIEKTFTSTSEYITWMENR